MKLHFRNRNRKLEIAEAENFGPVVVFKANYGSTPRESTYGDFVDDLQES